MTFDMHKIRQLEKGYKHKIEIFAKIKVVIRNFLFFISLLTQLSRKATTNSSKKSENERLLLIPKSLVILT